MKTPRYTWLIVLVCIALAGTIAIQGLWIHRGYVQSEQHLVEGLGKALQETATVLTEKERIAFIANLGDSAQEGNIKHTVKRVVHSDTVINVEAFVFDTILENVPLDGQGAKPHQLRLEYKTEIGSSDEDVSLTMVADSPVDRVVSMERDGRLKDLLDKIHIEEWVEKGSWQDRISMESLTEELYKQIENQEIESSFEFAVVNSENQPFKGYSSDSFDTNAQGTKATTRLFPSDLKVKDVYLMVFVQDVFGYVLSQMWILLCASLLFTSLMVFLFVVTIKKLMSQAKLSQLKTDFINNMSHELKTPLATISIATDSLQHKDIAESRDKIDALATTIRIEQKRILEHVDRVLHMAQASKGSFELQKESFSMKGILNDLIDQFRVQSDAAGVAISVDISNDYMINIDRLHFMSAMTNVLDNAIKYRSNEPEISISCQVINSNLLVEIRDNGIGMSKENAMLAFDRFHRAQSGNDHDVKGFGLGLSYVRSVIEAHQGTVTLESELSKGTIVKIEIPVHV